MVSVKPQWHCIRVNIRAVIATLHAILVRKSDYSYWIFQKLPVETPNSSFFIPSQYSPVFNAFLMENNCKSSSKAGFKTKCRLYDF